MRRSLTRVQNFAYQLSTTRTFAVALSFNPTVNLMTSTKIGTPKSAGFVMTSGKDTEVLMCRSVSAVAIWSTKGSDATGVLTQALSFLHGIREGWNPVSWHRGMEKFSHSTVNLTRMGASGLDVSEDIVRPAKNPKNTGRFVRTRGARSATTGQFGGPLRLTTKVVIRSAAVVLKQIRLISRSVCGASTSDGRFSFSHNTKTETGLYVLTAAEEQTTVTENSLAQNQRSFASLDVAAAVFVIVHTIRL
jgi:hypothetical protein